MSAAKTRRNKAKDERHAWLNKVRVGRCYELAERFVLDHPHCTLVRGSIAPGRRRYKHAWVETPDGRVWDPSFPSNAAVSAEDYRSIATPIADTRHTSYDLLRSPSLERRAAS